MGLDLNVYNTYGKRLKEYRIGGYLYFHNYRIELARQLGITLENMQGFSNGFIEWNNNIQFNYLLSHSDCDGKLTFKDCKKLLREFNTIKISFKNKDFENTHKDLQELILLAVKNVGYIEFA